MGSNKITNYIAKLNLALAKRHFLFVTAEWPKNKDDDPLVICFNNAGMVVAYFHLSEDFAWGFHGDGSIYDLHLIIDAIFNILEEDKQ